MVNVRTAFWVLGLATAAGGGLAGCAETPLSRYAGPVDAQSSAADAVREASAHPDAYPDLKRLPPVPRDLRPAPAYGSQAAALKTDKGALDAWKAAHPALVDDTDAYAEAARGRTLDPAKAAPPPDQAQRSEAWAAKMREAAKPPPPPGG